MNKLRLLYLICLFFLLAACSPAPSPTPPPTTPPPTVLPTATVGLPPTMDLTATMASVPTATAVPAPPTAVTPSQPTTTPTPDRVAINITSPDENVDIVMGSDIVVRGLVQLGPDHTVWLSLVSYTGHLLAEAQAAVGDVGWESGFTVPQTVSGAAKLQAAVRDESGQILAQDEVEVNLVLDTTTTDRYLAMFNPISGETAVAGLYFFFNGRTQNPVNQIVTIAIMIDECQTEAASFQIGLGGSGYWEGFVGVPYNISGPGCAVARFGVPGAENWREAQVPITIYAFDDSEARGINMGFPPPGSSVTAGQELVIYGTAFAAAEPVQVQIMMEDGRIVSQSNTFTDSLGYWEVSLILPVDVEGTAVITASAGDPGGGSYSEDQTLIEIKPAPTPTPGT